jgi:methionine-rich copper-binding protein CopC
MKRISHVMIIAGLLVLPLVALAHAHLEQSDPLNGSTVSVTPAHFMLVFSESARLTALSIQREGDASAQKVGPLPTEASKQFTIPAPKLMAGIYTLTFRTVAADDNHITSGTIRFTVAANAGPAAPSGK